MHAIVHETYYDELGWLAGQVIASRAAMAEPLWSEIGVLTRDNNHAADVFDALTSRGIPVEIVGLKGLMRLPEVSEVVSTLSLLQDLTANADLLNLLNGPRWAIGPRDLALLGRRARSLTGVKLREEGISVADELQRAVEGADPTEVLSLNDALADPGDLPYSAEARTRFGLLSEELRQLRTYAGEPLLDLVRRIIDVTGIDVELASSVSLAASARRDNLDLFVKAVADFQAIDGRVTLRLVAGLARGPRTRWAAASTRRRPPRPTRSSCSPSTAPRGWSGPRCSWSGSVPRSSRSTRRAASGPPCRKVLPGAPARRRRRRAAAARL